MGLKLFLDRVLVKTEELATGSWARYRMGTGPTGGGWGGDGSCKDLPPLCELTGRLQGNRTDPLRPCWSVLRAEQTPGPAEESGATGLLVGPQKASGPCHGKAYTPCYASTLDHGLE